MRPHALTVVDNGIDVSLQINTSYAITLTAVQCRVWGCVFNVQGCVQCARVRSMWKGVFNVEGCVQCARVCSMCKGAFNVGGCV